MSQYPTLLYTSTNIAIGRSLQRNLVMATFLL